MLFEVELALIDRTIAHHDLERRQVFSTLVGL